MLTPSADHVVGMGCHQGRELVDDLLSGSTTAEPIYSLQSREGDTVIWDNRGPSHRAVLYDSSSHRERINTTIFG